MNKQQFIDKLRDHVGRPFSVLTLEGIRDVCVEFLGGNEPHPASDLIAAFTLKGVVSAALHHIDAAGVPEVKKINALEARFWPPILGCVQALEQADTGDESVKDALAAAISSIFRQARAEGVPKR
ncbi:MAG: hypothetical protein OEM00_04810 [Burkholderiaceae bacterium]|nr:hypothetical protein [Burkholderiaceae bacterium]